MINRINKTEELKDSLLNVRRAHRLLKEYQERTLNIAFYIKEKFSMPYVEGRQRFSAPLRYKRDGYIKVAKDMWSWDFLYSYEFEYYFGVVETTKKRTYALSIIQVSDTGFYKISDSDPNDIKTFAPVEDSETAFVFIFEIIEKEDWIWEDKFDEAVKALCSEDDSIFKLDNRFLAVIYSLERFLNQENTDLVLRDFHKKVFNLCGIELLKTSKDPEV